MKAKALIIGNANYPANKLNNPENDANDLNDILKRLGFDTEILLNANTVTQVRSIVSFAKSLDNYDIGLFYFAGHGFQIDNENYLSAIDTNFDEPAQAKHSAFALNILLAYLNKAKNKTSIIILDACRTMLNKKSWYRSVEDMGLAPIYAPKGTIIAFATSPGEKAFDGIGKRNGIFTGALLQHIVTENIPIEEMFKRVRNTVYALSKGKQVSWEHTSLTGNFCFNSGQLSYSDTIEYNSQAIKDSTYEINTKTTADTIVKELKSHDWHKQNPAIYKLKLIDAAIEDKNKLFLIGRNILQSACGSARAAISFMCNLEDELKKLHTGGKNHVLDGIIFEMFFNSSGGFRQDEIKDDFLEEIYKVLEVSSFKESLNFLVKILLPYRDIIFYIPTLNPTGISFDIDFKIDSETNDIILEGIKYEGQNVFVKQEYDEIWGTSSETHYIVFKYNTLKRRIAKEIYIPLNKIVINTNIPIDDEQKLLYPDNYKIMK